MAAAIALMTAHPCRAKDSSAGICLMNNRPHLDFSMKDWLNNDFEKLVKNGMSHSIVVHITIKNAHGPVKALLETARLYRLRYYLWEDYFLLEITGPGGHRILKLRNYAALKKILSAPTPIPLSVPGSIPNQRRLTADIKIDLDPMSDAQLKKLHRHLANPRGSLTASAPGGASLFGTMAGLFVDRSKFRSRKAWSTKIKGFALEKMQICPPVKDNSDR
ncbi:MAG: hypothetical protein GXP49_15540 [Deltaproteobacteria bacterium]|nr:hypothetical protein [Deltaproteobacteria bacterium]